MSSLIQEATIRVKQDSASNWTSADTVLAQGEWGYETDTGYLKIGNGSTAWTSLAYTFDNTGASLSKYDSGWTICTSWTVGNSITINHALNTSFDGLIGQIFVRDPAVPGKIYNATDIEMNLATTGQRLNGINNDLDNCYLQIGNGTGGNYRTDSGGMGTVPTSWYYKVVIYKLS